MKVADFVNLFGEILKLLSKLDIKVSDYQYTNLFSDYASMTERGYKVSYIVAVLAGKYEISEASVYRILRRFKKAVKV